MGTGASATPRPVSAAARSSSARNSVSYQPRPPLSRPPSTSRSVSVEHRRLESWARLRRVASHDALKDVRTRRNRAIALGSSSVYTVTVSPSGFSIKDILMCEGQVLRFEWDLPQGQEFSVYQVFSQNEIYVSVPGGFNSGPPVCKDLLEQQFNLAGLYHFTISGIPQCERLNVNVKPRRKIEAFVTNGGFKPTIIRVDEGNSVSWQWEDGATVVDIREVKYNHKTHNVLPSDTDSIIRPNNRQFWREFSKPGLYYFQKESIDRVQKHHCIVHVRERQREYKVEYNAQTQTFAPEILEIDEGDRVWFEWKDTGVHSVCQVDSLGSGQGIQSGNQYRTTNNGFKWPNRSSTQGLMSHEFFTPGIFHFCDEYGQADHLHTIIVKPGIREHFVEASEEGFSEDPVACPMGDLLWFTWNPLTVGPTFRIQEVGASLCPVTRGSEVEEDGRREEFMDPQLQALKVEVGLECTMFRSIGVTHYTTLPGAGACSVISRAGAKNLTITVSDSGFEPNVIHAHVDDRIWWIWKQSSNPHNIKQVTHDRQSMTDGFSSGPLKPSPSSYTYQPKKPGVYYFISDSGSRSVIGAIFVSTPSQVCEVQVGSSISVDPCCITTNDVVAWIFERNRRADFIQIDRVGSLKRGMGSSVVQRKCLSHVFTSPGVSHFTSKSYLDQKKPPTEFLVSSVIADDYRDALVVLVDAESFHPSSVTVRTGQTIQWVWSDGQKHNIVHIEALADQSVQFTPVQGHQAFTSGGLVTSAKFVHTFDEVGQYFVTSEGAPGKHAKITIKERGSIQKVASPEIINDRGGKVEMDHVVHLKCVTVGAQIYYTVDGSTPAPHNTNRKRYKSSHGIILKKAGFCFVRALAEAEGLMTSPIVTSKRFYVAEEDEDAKIRKLAAPLPAAELSVKSSSKGRVKLKWSFVRTPEPHFKIDHITVVALGKKFLKTMTSDRSSVCNHPVLPGKQVTQHEWRLPGDRRSHVIVGLLPGLEYYFQLITTYKYFGNRHFEWPVTSTTTSWQTAMPSVILRALKSDLYKVTVGWDMDEGHQNVPLQGFRLLVDGQPMGDLIPVGVNQTSIDQLTPGRVISVQVQAIAQGKLTDSPPSNTVKVTCPQRPSAPRLGLQPSRKTGSVTVTWLGDKTSTAEVLFYRVFVDGNYHGDVTVGSHDLEFRYQLDNLEPGRIYQVAVKTYVGQRSPQADHIYCLCESSLSNTLPVTCSAPPPSPALRLEAMHADGLDLTWDTPQQYGEATLSGYQLVSNGKISGAVIPADIHKTRMRGLSLGQTVHLQIMALTDHAVGKEPPTKDHNYSHPGGEYLGCRPGPTLTVTYDGLVTPPASVWLEHITGHSAIVAWKNDNQPRYHFVFGEEYQVTWWPTEQPDNKHSQITKGLRLLLDGLIRHTSYTVQVEARKWQHYTAVSSTSTTTFLHTATGLHSVYLLPAMSSKVQFNTSVQPRPVTRARLVATTNNSVQVEFESKQEDGTRVAAMRVDAVSSNPKDPNNHQSILLRSDVSSVIIDSLSEHSEYTVYITVVCEEYFESLDPEDPVAKSRRLPNNKLPPKSPWLPSASIKVNTSGFEPPHSLTVDKISHSKLVVSWAPASVYGANKILGYVVSWSEENLNRSVNHRSSDSAFKVEVAASENKAKLTKLKPASAYRVTLEARVSTLTTLHPEVPNPDPTYRKTVAIPADKALVINTEIITPDPPQITATIEASGDKSKLERIVCYLINKRDRLLNILAGERYTVKTRDKLRKILSDEKLFKTSAKRILQDRQMLEPAVQGLAQTEKLLDTCLSSLHHYNEHLLVNLSWTCPQITNPKLKVSGYNILVDGQPFGYPVGSDHNSVKIELSAAQPVHRISMTAFIEKPYALSKESNTVKLKMKRNLPFDFFILLKNRTNNGTLTTYQDILEEERRYGPRLNINKGLLLSKHHSPPYSLPDLFTGQYRALVPDGGPQKPTVVLFWADWCRYSTTQLTWFIDFARANIIQYDFICVAATPGDNNETARQSLVKSITKNGWNDESVRHCGSQAHRLGVHFDCKFCEKHKHKEDNTLQDVFELMDVVGVPSIVIIHPDNYVAWHGRYCAWDYSSFEHFLNYILALSMKYPQIPLPDPWEVTAIDIGSLSTGKFHYTHPVLPGSLVQLQNQPSYQPLPSAPSSLGSSQGWLNMADAPRVLLDIDNFTIY